MITQKEIQQTVLYLIRNKVKNFTPYITTIGPELIQLIKNGLSVDQYKEILKSSKIITQKQYIRQAHKFEPDMWSILQGENHYQKATTIQQLKSKDFYVVDHKISCFTGYKYGVTLEDINHISNLRIISGYENNEKGKNNYIDSLNSWLSYKYGIL